MTNFKKAVIISGGAALGAYGGGTLARINKKYDIAIGISTGALMSPLVLLGDWNMLNYAYTSLKQHNIFDKCWYKPSPFKEDGRIKVLPVLISLLVGDRTISTSNNLRKTIETFFTKDQYDTILANNKNIIVAAQNLVENPSRLHYFNLKYESYEDFLDWMWCSANVPLFTSLVKKNWKDEDSNFHVGMWCDGGVSELIALDQAIGKQIKEVDVIIHRMKPQSKFEGKKILNLVDTATATINAMRFEIELEQLNNKIKELTDQGIKVNVWWLPKKLTKNSLIFDKKQMSQWWDEGYATAFDKNRMEVFEPSKKS
jgi:NTE family protein